MVGASDFLRVVEWCGRVIGKRESEEVERERSEVREKMTVF